MGDTMSVGVFPVVRRLSRPVVAFLLHFPVSPNQITTLSLIAGLGAAACFLENSYYIKLVGALLFVVCYLLDNCDGEVARIKHMSSQFGNYYDTFVDWIVHTALFLSLGYSNFKAGDDILWLWLGIFAGTGATINYLLGFFIGNDDECQSTTRQQSEYSGLMEFFILIFRELSRADFCFILLILTLINYEWVLLPATAIGAQIYWMTRFAGSAKKFHV